jgi:hypothetical protein
LGCNGSAERSWRRGILICPIEKWYYKKEQSNFKTQFNTYTRWNLEFKLTNMNKIYNPTPESWSAILERPTKTIDDIELTVKEIFKEVQKKGDEAIHIVI